MEIVGNSRHTIEGDVALRHDVHDGGVFDRRNKSKVTEWDQWDTWRTSSLLCEYLLQTASTAIRVVAHLD